MSATAHLLDGPATHVGLGANGPAPLPATGLPTRVDTVAGHAIAPTTLLLAWLVAGGAGVALDHLDHRLVLAPAAIVAASAALATSSRLARRALTAAASATAALVPLAPEAAWVAAAALAAAALLLRPRPERSTVEDLQRHIAWCRRRQADADVLVLETAAATAPSPATLRDLLRLTDTAVVHDERDAYRLEAVLDADDLSRDGVEQRVRAMLGEDARVGWARFPEQGVTLEVLCAAARGSLRPVGSAGDATGGTAPEGGR